MKKRQKICFGNGGTQLNQGKKNHDKGECCQDDEKRRLGSIHRNLVIHKFVFNPNNVQEKVNHQQEASIGLFPVFLQKMNHVNGFGRTAFQGFLEIAGTLAYADFTSLAFIALADADWRKTFIQETGVV